MLQLLKSKVFWTAVIGLVTSVAGYFTGEIDLKTLVGAAFSFFLAVFFRDALLKGGAIEPPSS
jgi:uncharacterized membrane protein